MDSRLAIDQRWRVALPLMGLMIAGLFALFFNTADSIVSIWNHYETFTHGYIIVPISLWLIWQQRSVLADITPQPSGLGLLVFLGAAFGWLLGNLSGAQVVMQYAFAAMIPAAVFTLLGWSVVRPILFPLLFLLLAVPFGDVFIDPLMNLTADFTVTALQLTGVPVFREGNTLTIPTGVWSVVEACSGVRYLIASVTLGIIYAYLTYRSRWRQILFVIAAILVPILANGLRAYMIVMIGHLSNMKYGAGIDHLIYGWVFFGVVMLILFWVGSFWREDSQPAKTQVAPQVAKNEPPVAPWLFMLFAFAALAVAVAAPAYSTRVERFMAKQPAVVLAEPVIAGWRSINAFTAWRPEFKNPAVEQMRFLSRNDQLAGLYIGYYRNQNQGSELIRYGNVLAMPDGKQWRRMRELVQVVPVEHLAVHQNLLAQDQQRLLGWYWYWTGNSFTTNSYVAKAHLAFNRLLMRPDDSAVVVVFAPFSGRPEEAATAMQQLLQDALPVIRQQLEAARRQ